MKLSEQLINKTQVEKNFAKCDVLQKTLLTQFTVDGFDVTVLEKSIEGDMLKVVVDATFKGKPINIDNPLYYKNPPILVPDGTKRSITNNLGVTYEIDNFKEDPEEAFKNIIIDTIKLWRP